MSISIAVCTYNGSNKLISLLDSVAESTNDIDVYIIDNNSTDDTKELIFTYMEKSNLRINYFFEAGKGLSQARNKAIAEINSEYIVFTDDDVIVKKDWIKNLKHFIENNDFGMAFGMSLMFDDRPDKLSTKDSEEKEIYQYPCSPFGIGHGNNMVIKKSVIHDVGLFDKKLGAGTCVGSAEDLDYCYRVLKKGYRIIYSPEFVIYHNHQRTTPEEYNKIRVNYAMGRGAFYIKHLLKLDKYILKLIYWSGLGTMKNRLTELKGAFIYIMMFFNRADK